MKKNTLFVAAFLAAASLSAQSSLTWKGTINDSIWSTTASNWEAELAPGVGVPSNWVTNSIAIFNGGGISQEGETEYVKVSGDIVTVGISVSGSKDYVIQVKTSGTLAGDAALVKEGSGDFIMNVENKLTGGTVIREGRVMMQKQESPNVFGSKLILDGGIANFATTTSSKYPDISLPVEIIESKSGVIELSRYSYFSSPITGSGDLVIYAGGERTYLGKKNAQPDWSNFEGNVTVYPYKMEGVAPGFYGLILNTSKSVATADMDDDDILNPAIDSTFYNRRLALMAGTAIAAESSSSGISRVYDIGELTAEDGTVRLYGYYKNNDYQNICYRIGGLNTDVVFPGQIAPAEKNDALYRKTYVSIMKVGTGTYTLTNGNNFISGGLDIRQGKVFIANDPSVAGTSGTGYRGGEVIGAGSVAIVKSGAAIGGTGIISGNVELLEGGILEPGCNNIGTLTFNGYINYGGLDQTVDANLLMHGGAIAEFELSSAVNHDKLDIASQVRYYNEDGKKPVINVSFPSTYQINDGDEFVLISAAKGKHELSTSEIEVNLPTIAGVTFSYEERVETNADETSSYKLIVKATGSATGIAKTAASENLSVYPNPSNGEFTIEGADIQSVEIFNNQGQLLNAEVVNAVSAKVDLSGMTKGIYFAKIKTTEGLVVKKLVIR